MRRADDDLFQKVPAVRLYGEDLRHLCTLIDRGGGIELRYGEFLYDSVDELVEKIQRQPLRELEVNPAKGARGPSLTIVRGQVYVHGAGGISSAEILEFLRRKRAPFALPAGVGWYGVSGALVSVVAGAMCLGIGALVGQLTGNPAAGVGAGVAAFLPLSALIFWNPVGLGQSAVYLYDRHGRASFWDRNRDTIAVGILMAILGIALGRFIG